MTKAIIGLRRPAASAPALLARENAARLGVNPVAVDDLERAG